MLENKNVLVTGGASGIGLEIAKAFLDKGSTVYICGRNKDKLTNIAKEYPKIKTIQCDVTEDTDIERLLKSIDRIDILVNNAGVLIQEPLVETSTNSFNTQMRTNFNSAYLLSRLAAPKMLERKYGFIIQIASAAATDPLRNLSIYSASKAALVAMTKSMGIELKDTNVKTCCISPGPTDTPLLQENIGTKESKRYMSPKEVANLSIAIAEGKRPIENGENIIIGKLTFTDKVINKLRRTFK